MLLRRVIQHVQSQNRFGWSQGLIGDMQEIKAALEAESEKKGQ